MTKANLIKTIILETSNQIGAVKKLTELLSKNAKVNIQSINAEVINGKGQINLSTDDNAKVSKALQGSDFNIIGEKDAIVLEENPNKQGNINNIANKIAEAGINIDYLRSTSYKDQPAIIISTNDNQKTINILK